MKSSKNSRLAKVKSKHTEPEMLVRRFLFKKGIRYTLHSNNLPGKPDIVIRKKSIVIFVNGCFWHGHEHCTRSKLPKTNTQFWNTKIQYNIEREVNNVALLKQTGWKVIIIWECKLHPNTRLQTLTSLLVDIQTEMETNILTEYIDTIV
jgi:DNA mismatch endonuclease (patch repair protein)